MGLSFRYLAVFVFLLFASCKEDIPEPCSATKTKGAGISITQGLLGSGERFEVDTLLIESIRGQRISQWVQFTAKDIVGPFSWRVGDDPRTFTDSTFTLSFNDPGEVVQVRMEAAKLANSCQIGGDMLRDTAALYLLSHEVYPYPYEGRFSGTSTERPDSSFIVTIGDLGEWPVHDDGSWYGLRIHNLPAGCGGPQLLPDKFTPELQSRLYRQFYFRETGASETCPEIDGTGIIKGDTLTIEYTYRKTGTDAYFTSTFSGKRIKE